MSWYLKWTALVFAALLIAFALPTFVADVPTLDRCFSMIGDEKSRAAREWLRYEQRDLSKKALIFLGGSDVREIIDTEIVDSAIGDLGYQTFNFGKTSRNELVEIYQTASNIELGPEDVLFVNVAPEDLSLNKVPAFTSNWESAWAYRDRMRIKKKEFDPTQYFRLWLGSNFKWFFYRDLIRSCLFKSKVRNKPSFRKGDDPQPVEVLQREISKRQGSKKIGFGKIISPTKNRNLALLRVLRARFGKQLKFTEVHRNPFYKFIYDEDYLKSHYAAVSELNPTKFSDLFEMDQPLFYDFNHVHSGGRKFFTEHLIVWLREKIGKGEI